MKKKPDTGSVMKVLEKRPLLPLLCTILLIMLGLPDFAMADEVFFPFISNLRIAVRDDNVRLTWRDVPGYTNDYLIYRHTDVISENNINEARRIGRIQPGVEQFTDLPPDTNSYYYAVLTEEQPGRPLAVFIPFRNHTVRPVTIHSTTQTIAGAQVSTIAAEQHSDHIQLSFTADRDDRSLSVLRATSPIRAAEDIVSATLLGEVGSDEQQYTDTPPREVAYYYGIFDAELMGSDDLIIRPGDNTTIRSVALSEPTQATATARPEVTAPIEDSTERLTSRLSDYQAQPLPLLQSRFSEIQQTGIGGFPTVMPDKQAISTETEKAIQSLQARYASSGSDLAFEPVLLSPEHDLWHRSSQLDNILANAFATEKWHQAHRELTALLQSTIADNLEQHALFYRGQLSLLMGNAEDAFFDLLLVRDSFYAEVQPMIETALRKLQL